MFVPVKLNKCFTPHSSPWIYQLTAYLFIVFACWFIKELNYMIGCCKYYNKFYSEQVESFGRVEETFNYT